MSQVNFKRELASTLEEAISKITEALASEGFGILTRIDFHTKIKDKLNKDLPPIVILGACHPGLAYEVYQREPNFTSVLPCNVVVRDLGKGKVSIEIAKPTAMMKVLENKELIALAEPADQTLRNLLDKLS